MSFFLASYVLVQATAGTTGGTMQVLGTDLAPATNKGRFFAIWRMLAQAGALAAPAAYAYLAEHVSYGVGFLLHGRLLHSRRHRRHTCPWQHDGARRPG